MEQWCDCIVVRVMGLGVVSVCSGEENMRVGVWDYVCGAGWGGGVGGSIIHRYFKKAIYKLL